MAFLLNRSRKQLVGLSSSWATPSLRLLTSVNNCFSTTSYSTGGMIQESNPKDVVADAAFEDLLVNCGAYFIKYIANAIQNKPVPSTDDFYKFLDDQFEKLPPLDVSETDQAVKNPKATTSEDIKVVADFADAITGGLFRYLPRPAFKFQGENFLFNLVVNGVGTCRLDLTVNVSGLAKEHLVVWVVRERVIVTSKRNVAPDQKVLEAITVPKGLYYDPDKVTGTIMEDGQLKISFPASKEGAEPEEMYFEVNLV